MSISLILACLWAIAATVIAMMPSRDHHWRAAYLLIVAGIPILGFVTYQNGPVAGLLVLAAGASMLRWPVIYLWRWLKRGGAPAPVTVPTKPPAHPAPAPEAAE